MNIMLDKKAVARSFSKAAPSYDQFAQLQRAVGSELFNHLANYSTQDSVENILDLGCGTGFFSEKLIQAYPHSQLTCLDLSTAMLAQVAKKQQVNLCCLQGDIDHLPFTANSFDLIFGNLVIQWSDSLAACLQQLKTVLNPGGKLVFSTLLQGSLDELTQAWKRVDEHPHTNEFIRLNELQSLLTQCGFNKVTIKTEQRVLHYDNVLEVMRALKGIGANHVHGHQQVTVTGRTLLGLLEQGYQPFINKHGQLRLTYQICYVEVEK